MLKLSLSSEADKFVAKREPKHQRQIYTRIQALREDPSPSDAKSLGHLGGKFSRVDTGEYRIIFRIEGETLHVPVVGKRNDDEVYRRLKRK